MVVGANALCLFLIFNPFLGRSECFVQISKKEQKDALKALDQKIKEEGKISAATILKRGLPFSQDELRRFRYRS